jgi:hypothetical protein
VARYERLSVLRGALAASPVNVVRLESVAMSKTPKLHPDLHIAAFLFERP